MIDEGQNYNVFVKRALNRIIDLLEQKSDPVITKFNSEGQKSEVITVSKEVKKRKPMSKETKNKISRTLKRRGK